MFFLTFCYSLELQFRLQTLLGGAENNENAKINSKMAVELVGRAVALELDQLGSNQYRGAQQCSRILSFLLILFTKMLFWGWDENTELMTHLERVGLKDAVERLPKGEKSYLCNTTLHFMPITALILEC